MKYKIACSGWMVVEVEADTEAEATDKVYEDESLGELYNLEIEEVVPADKAFEYHTDLN